MPSRVMRVTLTLAGPAWLWIVLLWVLGLSYAASAFMRARLAYWQRRVERERQRRAS